MDKCEELKQLLPQQFRRLIWGKRETFFKMVEILVTVKNGRYRKAKRRGG